jgi:acetoacetyl-CoA synthetase
VQKMSLAAFGQLEYCPEPAQIATSRLTEFGAYCESGVGHPFEDWRSFDQFAVENFRFFWEALKWSALPLSGSVRPVCVGEDCETAQFFPSSAQLRAMGCNQPGSPRQRSRR